MAKVRPSKLLFYDFLNHKNCSFSETLFRMVDIIYPPMIKARREVANLIKNKTGLQPVSRPVEQPLLGFKTVKKVEKVQKVQWTLENMKTDKQT